MDLAAWVSTDGRRWEAVDDTAAAGVRVVVTSFTVDDAGAVVATGHVSGERELGLWYGRLERVEE